MKEGFQPLLIQQERVVTARQEDNSCAFLDERNLCQLHSELGGSKKPLVCQTYPYLFTQTPDGIFATISYACPAAVEGAGPPLEEQRPELEALIARRWDEVPQACPVSDRVEVTRGCAISWGQYLQLERQLLESLSTEHPVDALLAAAVHLIVAEPESGDFRWPEDGLDFSRPYNFGGFDRQLACMVACNLLAITEDVVIAEERARLGSFFWNGGRHLSTRFGLMLPAFSLSRPCSQTGQQLVLRYLRGAIFGKRLLAGTVVSRLLALVCGVAILLFYTEAFLAQGDEELVAYDRAFALIESELLSHTRSFDGFFLEFEQALRSVRDELRAG